LAIFHGETARKIAQDLERAARVEGGADWDLCQQLAEMLSLEMARLKPEMERFVQSQKPQ
ncbi:hypothetical protein JZU51_00050, partial [bacterium]|nr:hypothetical protein [bacterium]